VEKTSPTFSSKWPKITKLDTFLLPSTLTAEILYESVAFWAKAAEIVAKERRRARTNLILLMRGKNFKNSKNKMIPPGTYQMLHSKIAPNGGWQRRAF
jgi:hypothetical protein